MSESQRRPRRALIISMSDLRHDSRVLKFARALHTADWEVTVMGLVAEAGDPLEERLDFAHLVRVPTSRVPYEATGRSDTGAARPSAARRALAWASRARWIDSVRHFAGRMRESYLFYRAALPLEPTVALTCNPSTMLAGWLLKRRLHVRFVHDIREVWTGQHEDVHLVYEFLYNLLETRLVRKADAVTAVNEFVGAELARRANIAEPHAILNGSIECLDPSASTKGPVRLLFQGRFAEDRGLPALLEAMSRVGDGAVLTLQGWGVLEPELRERINRLGLGDRIRIVPPAAPFEVVSSAARHDVGVIPYPLSTPNLRLSSPNKLFDYLGAGLAIASTDAPFMRRVVETHGCGVVFDASDLEAMTQALRDLVSDREAIARMKAASARACREYSWDGQAAKLVRIFDELVS